MLKRGQREGDYGATFRAQLATRDLADGRFWLMWHGGTVMEAGKLYVYTDAQGQAVLTDNVQQVPAEYRGRLRTVTNGEPPATAAMTSAAEPAASSPLPTSECVAGDLHARWHRMSIPIKGLTPHQTAVVILRAPVGMALLLLMFLSSNPAIRLLAKCLLVLVSLAAVYQLVVGGVICHQGRTPAPLRQHPGQSNGQYDGSDENQD